MPGPVPGRSRRPFLTWQLGPSQTWARRARRAQELDIRGGVHQTACLPRAWAFWLACLAVEKVTVRRVWHWNPRGRVNALAVFGIASVTTPSVVLTCTVGELLVKQSQDHPAPGAVRPWTGCDGSQHGSQRRQKGPSTERVGACDLGALGGTRTPSLLIRSQMLYPLSYERLANPR